MSIRIETYSVDAHDPYTIAQWWALALGWEVTDGGPGADEVSIAPPSDSPQRNVVPELLFCKVPEGKSVKNRIHLDLRPDDQAAEVERFERLGATRTDVGQEGNPDATWVVLSDPEGNEFCILRTRQPS
jgi:hypothetical protein